MGALVHPIPEMNTRETALAAWSVAFLTFALVKRDIRKSLGAMLKTFFGSIYLSGALVLATAYAGGTVLLLRDLGYRNDRMAPIAVFWFVGVGLVALFNDKPAGSRYFQRLVLRNLALVAIVEFVVNLHTFALLVELILVPVVLLLAMIEALTEYMPEFAPMRNPLAWVLTLIGVLSLSFSIAYIAGHFHKVATIGKVEQFFLPVALTTCFVPFLYFIRMFIAYQTTLQMTRFGLNDNAQLYRFARRLILRACGFSLGRAQSFEEKFRGRLWGVDDEAGVTDVIDEFRRVWDAQRSHVVGSADSSIPS
jgi:hypothetical protein